MKREIITTEQLRYRFTPEEHRQNTDELVSKLGQRSEMEDTHKAVKANLKEQVERIESEIGRLVRLSRDGYDIRDVRCRWEYNHPGVGQKTLMRLDSVPPTEVRTEMMLEHERQESLKFEGPSHILDGPGSLKGKRVDEVSDSDIEMFASRDVEDLLKFSWLQTDIDAVHEEHRRRAKARGENVEEKAEAVAEEPAVEDDGTKPEPPVMADDTAGCALCDSGIPLAEGNGSHHVDGSTCPVGIRNARIAAGHPVDEEPVEAAHTLPSVRAIDGHKKTQRRAAAVKPPTKEERALLDQMEAEEAEQFPDYDLRDDAPEV